LADVHKIRIEGVELHSSQLKNSRHPRISFPCDSPRYRPRGMGLKFKCMESWLMWFGCQAPVVGQYVDGISLDLYRDRVPTSNNISTSSSWHMCVSRNSLCAFKNKAAALRYPPIPRHIHTYASPDVLRLAWHSWSKTLQSTHKWQKQTTMIFAKSFYPLQT